MKKAIPWFIVIGLVLALLMVLDRSCKDLAAEKEAHQAAERLAASDHAIMLSEIAKRDAAIAEREKKEKALEAEIARKNTEIADQDRTIAELQAAEPPTTPDIEAMPIVISLRAQVKELTTGFSLAKSTIKDQAEEIKNLKLDKIDLAANVEKWKTEYEKEKKLHEEADGLFNKSQRQLKLGKAEKWVYRIVGAAGWVYGLTR